MVAWHGVNPVLSLSCFFGGGVVYTLPSKADSMAKITVKFKSSFRKEYQLNKPVVQIGRDPDSDVLIDNQAVSRYHARITQRGGQFLLEDLQSNNGTFVNCKRIKTHVLQEDDEILVGKHSLYFNAWHDDPETGPSAEVPPVAAPKSQPQFPDNVDLDGTIMLQSNRASATESGKGGPPGSASSGVATLFVLPVGKSLPGHRSRFELTRTSTTIGKSASAIIRLAGWLTPALVGLIVRDVGGYFLVPGTGWFKLRHNGKPLTSRKPLTSGDLLEIRGYKFEFKWV